MNNSTVCPQCGREAIDGWLPCKCDHSKAESRCCVCGKTFPYGEGCPDTWDEQHRSFNKAVQGVGYPWPAPLPPWNLPVKHEPSQDDKLDKILALLEQIKERL